MTPSNLSLLLSLLTVGLLCLVVLGVGVLLWKTLTLFHPNWTPSSVEPNFLTTTTSKAFHNLTVETGVGVPKPDLIDAGIERDEILWAFEHGANDLDEAHELITRDKHIEEQSG